MARVPVYRVGCSGWQYKHWKGNFYPPELRQHEWLEYYARQFDTVEVNNSFYRLPPEGVFESWRARTPARFLFAVKASRFLTHMKKLKDPEEPVERLFSRAMELRSKLGPVLYQLPKQLPRNIERLAAFLEILPPRVKHAVEFREPSWYDGRCHAAPSQAQRRPVPARHARLCDAAGGDRAIYVRAFSRRHG